MADIDAIFSMIDEVSAETRRVRLEFEKLVSTRKQEIKDGIISSAKREWDSYLYAINAQITPCAIPLSMPDFAGAIKGKRTIESIQNAIDLTLLKQQRAADSELARIKVNLDVVRNAGNDLLFADIATLCLKDKEIVAMTVKQRLADHKAAQDAQEELEAQEKQAEQAAVQAEIQLSPTASSATQHDDGERITLGNVCGRLGITMTSEFVKTTLGINPIEIECESKLYTEAQFQQICCALERHVCKVRMGYMDSDVVF